MTQTAPLSPQRIVALIDSVQKCRPHDSLVLLALETETAQTGRSSDQHTSAGRCCAVGSVRVDFSDVTRAAVSPKRLAAQCLDFVRALGDVDRVIPAVFGPSHPADAPPIDDAAADGYLWVLQSAFAAAGIEVSDAVLVRGRWCRVSGDPKLFELPAAVVPTVEQALALPSARPLLARDCEMLRRAGGGDTDSLGAFLSMVCAVVGSGTAGSAGCDAEELWDRHLTAAAVRGAELIFADPCLRDACCLLLAGVHPRFDVDCEGIDDGAAFPHLAAAILAGPEVGRYWPGTSHRRPDLDRLESVSCLLRALSAYVDTGSLPAVMAVLAWFEWARGRSSCALHYARAALSFDPAYSLAQLISRVAGAQLLPGWVRADSQEGSARMPE